MKLKRRRPICSGGYEEVKHKTISWTVKELVRRSTLITEKVKRELTLPMGQRLTEKSTREESRTAGNNTAWAVSKKGFFHLGG